MYIRSEDYYQVISREDLEALLCEGEVSRESCERITCAEVGGYFRGRYKINGEYNKTGNDRNEYIVLIVVDCCLYHMFSRIPGRISGDDVRKIRYDAALKWLRDVRDGKADPGIPSISDTTPEGIDPETNPEAFQSIRWGSMERANNDY